MSETLPSINPETVSPPVQEKKVESFPLSKLMECMSELTTQDFESLESFINEGKIESDKVVLVRKVVEAMREVNVSEDKNSTLKGLVPILVDLIHARNIVDGFIEKTEINQNLSSGIYHLVDAVYEVAPEEDRALATDAVLKTVDEELKAVEGSDKTQPKK